MNPNGIVFGENARLDIGGSFLATSAESMKFSDGSEFSATNPQSKPLLTINVPMGLQFASNPGSVSVSGSNLQVNSDRNLAFVGGNVLVDGGKLVAPSGFVELAGVTGENTIGLFPNGNFFTLNFAQGLPLADVSLSNQAQVNVLSSRGGNIIVNAANLNMSGESQLLTGISGVGSPKTQAGDIKINATGIVDLASGSEILNQVETNAVGNSGNININAESLSLSNNSSIAASTTGQGNAGNLTINTGSLSAFEGSFLAASANGSGDAGDININANDGVLLDRAATVFTDVTGMGKGGEINIKSGLLTVTNASKLDSGTSGIGDAGDITFNTNSLSVTNNSEAIASTSGVGNAGNLTFNTDSLLVNNESFLAASANGRGNAGNITINANGEVTFDNGAKLYTDVNQLPFNNNTEIKGDGGDIEINSGSLLVRNGAQLITSTSGIGNAGNIIINTDLLLVNNESFLAASANGRGDAGNITINNANGEVIFDNGAKLYTDVNQLPFSNNTEIKGDGGDIEIKSGSLLVRNGAQVITSTSGIGDAGNITINTGSLSVTENAFLAAGANGQNGNAGNINITASDGVLLDRAAAVYTNVTGMGKGGEINIKSGFLTVTNASKLDSGTSGIGDAGDITFNTNSLSVTNNSEAIASTSGVGNAGNLTFNTDSLLVNNESFLAASANGRGNAGNITINNANGEVTFDNGAKLYTDVNQLPFSNNTEIKGDGGNIEINSGLLLIRNGAQLISNTQGEGNAGNITINTGSLAVTDSAFLAASANGQNGNAGDINITARDRVLFDKGSAFSNVGVCSLIAVGCTLTNNTIKGDGGDITIKAPSLQLTNNSFLATGVGDDILLKNIFGTAGNISIHLRDDLSLDKSYITSRLFPNAKGEAGNIDIQAGFISSNQSLISASTQGQGNAGGISLQVADKVSLTDSDISTAVEKGATGDARGINITGRSLFLTDGAQLNAVTSGAGKAGNILIDTTDEVSISGTNSVVTPTNLFDNNIPPRYTSPPKFVDGVSSGIFSSTNSSGFGGDITVNTNTFSISNGSVVDARTTASGRGGVIKFNTNSFEAISGGQLTATTSGDGNAGSIILNDIKNVKISGFDPINQSLLAQFGEQIDIYGKPKVSSIDAASKLAVNSTGFGNAGNINVKTGSMYLDNKAVVTANTQSVNKDPKKPQANININNLQDLILRRGSNITTNAQGENVIGGNINIDNDVLAVLEKSIISANSTDFRGGRVTINTQGIFGNQPWYPEVFRGYITATGATPDLSGTVQINTPDIDPNNGLIELPVNLVDASNQISNACTPRSREFQNTFVSTGRGGLPMSPTEPLQENNTLSSWVRLKPGTSGNTAIEPQLRTVAAKNQIVEATGWIVDKDGNIEFVAQANQTNPKSQGQAPISCRESQ